MTCMGDVITELMHEWLNVYQIKNVVGIYCNDILLMSIHWVTREISKQSWNSSQATIFYMSRLRFERSRINGEVSHGDGILAH
jgi:hypothetical protein